MINKDYIIKVFWINIDFSSIWIWHIINHKLDIDVVFVKLDAATTPTELPTTEDVVVPKASACADV